MRILHILRYSLPYISGSTIRSKYIFKYQKNFAKIFVLTSFLFNKSKNKIDIIEGIPYLRFNKNIAFLMRNYYYLIEKINYFFYIHFNIYFEDILKDLILAPIIKFYLKKIIKKYNIEIIHAHTIYQMAKYALSIAKKKKIPFVYEVRGFIEENLILSDKIRVNNKNKLLRYKFNRIKEQETKIIKKADIIITLSQTMKKEIMKRNIKEKNIKIIHNCTDSDLLRPVKTNEKLKKKLRLNGYKILNNWRD